MKANRANIVLGAVVAVALVAAIAALAWTQLGAGQEAKLRVVVHDGDGAVHVLPLDENAELVVATSLGTNVVVVKDGAVRVREADCPGLDCVHQGELSAPGRQIICLPHKLWIEVVADGDGGGPMDVDAVADGFDSVTR